jgi:hypothetical protein
MTHSPGENMTSSTDSERVLPDDTPPAIVQATVQSVMAAELLDPGDEFWLLAPDVWNVRVLDNRANAFRHLEPNWPQAHIRLISVLVKLAEEGTNVHILTTDARKNETFVSELSAIEAEATSISVRCVDEWKDRPILMVSPRFALRGGLTLSKNSGITATAPIRLITGKATVTNDYEECRALWEST